MKPGDLPSTARLFDLRRAVVLISATCVACVGSDDSPRCEPLVEGIPMAMSEGTGRWERDGLVATTWELWRRGGTNPGEELAFPIFPSVSVGGRLAIPDFQLGEVVVVEPDGTWRGSRMPSGEGPGEVATPLAVTWAGEDELVAFDIVNSKVVVAREPGPNRPDIPVDPEITAPIVSSGQLIWAGVQPGGAVLVHPAWSRRAPGRGIDSHLAAILRLPAGSADAEMVSRVTFPAVSIDGRGDWPVPGWPLPVAGVGAGGRLAIGATDGTYRILVSDSTGAAMQQVCRPAEPRPLTRAERGEAYPPGFDALAASIRAAPHPPAPGPFGRIIVGARGRLWVQRERPPAYPGSTETLYGVPGGAHDVFDSDGAYLGFVKLPAEATLQAARGDTVWAFETGELDEVWVVAYRIELQTAPDN